MSRRSTLGISAVCIGMFGDSYEAQTQIAAASTGKSHLKAILPGSCEVSMPYLLDKVPISRSILAEAGFLLQGEPLIVTIYEVE